MAGTIHPTLVAWRLWVEASWPLLLSIDENKGKLAEAAMRFSEEQWLIMGST